VCPTAGNRYWRGAKGHAALVWVHGGVHGHWGITMFPFVKEAVERGYVVIAPDCRGSTGYVATNDTDVNFVEDQQIVDALRSRKPDLAETKGYVDPAP